MGGKLYARMAPLALGLVLLVLACGGSPAAQSPPVVFKFRIRGKSASEEFRVATQSADFIARARAQLSLPEAQRRLFPAGAIAAGDGGFNNPWGWHHVDPALTEAAIELCDGTPSMVQAELPYWLGTVKSFCPWNAYVYAEGP